MDTVWADPYSTLHIIWCRGKERIGGFQFEDYIPIVSLKIQFFSKTVNGHLLESDSRIKSCKHRNRSSNGASEAGLQDEAKKAKQQKIPCKLTARAQCLQKGKYFKMDYPKRMYDGVLV